MLKATLAESCWCYAISGHSCSNQERITLKFYYVQFCNYYLSAFPNATPAFFEIILFQIQSQPELFWFQYFRVYLGSWEQILDVPLRYRICGYIRSSGPRNRTSKLRFQWANESIWLLINDNVICFIELVNMIPWDPYNDRI